MADMLIHPESSPGQMATAIKGEAPRLAVMCCGLGSAFTGMGRELYENFPVCRNAMDELAAQADWDVLGLMDEKNLDEINRSRKQIPYLFLLQYAQWKQYVSLGLNPALMSGHSIGELAALCFAGIYSFQSAWHLLDIRAEHMAILEAMPHMQGGMLAVSGPEQTVSQVLSEYPDLRIANHNSPRQYILSGPVESLMAARKNLRHQRVPAFRLNMNLAFHHPAMRVLRELSMRRLNALSMREASIPMLSCVTTNLYPPAQDEICRYIADLDENTVEWVGCLTNMKHNFGISHLLELGPQETLCSLAGDNDPDFLAIPSSRKGSETQAMLDACGRLYELGHLQRKPDEPAKFHFVNVSGEDSIPTLPAETQIIRQILAEVTGIDPENILPGMNLRRDLGIRSSRFPYLLQQANIILNKSVQPEQLLQVSTVGDLAEILAYNRIKGDSAGYRQDNESGHLPFYSPITPLERFTWNEEAVIPLYYDPGANGVILETNTLVAVCSHDQGCMPGLLAGLAPLGLRFALPPSLHARCFPLSQAGSKILPLPLPEKPDQHSLDDALATLSDDYGEIGALLFIPPPLVTNDSDQTGARRLYRNCLQSALRHIRPHTPAYFLQRVIPIHKNELTPEFLDSICPDIQIAKIIWVDERKNLVRDNPDECGDMLAREVAHGSSDRVLWKNAARRKHYCPSSRAFRHIWPAETKEEVSGLFEGECQFSTFAQPVLKTHGHREPSTHQEDVPFYGAAWLPPSCFIRAMAYAGQFLLPQLSPAGFSDIRVHSRMELPDAITRECRVSAKLQAWLPLEGKMTRMARTGMSLRSLHPNGRATDIYKPYVSGLALYAAEISKLRPIWANMPDLSQPSAKLEADSFYDLLGFGQEWRYLSSFSADWSKRGIICGFSPKLDIATGGNWDYNTFLLMLDAAFQGAMGAMELLTAEKPDQLPQPAINFWQLSSIGYIRHTQIDNLSDNKIMNPVLQIRETWRDGNIWRFDAQINAEKPLLTVYHLEFVKSGE